MTASVTVSVATPGDRDAIDALRHAVYAEELRQYACAPTKRLGDAHPHSTILCARRGSEILGYIAVTPPGSPTLRIEHYLSRESLPFCIGPRTAEARQLTVRPDLRDSSIATRLLLGCFSWLASHDVEDVVTIGHDAVVSMYERYGARRAGIRLTAGGVEYEVLHTKMDALRSVVGRLQGIGRILRREDEEASTNAGACPHGGAALALAGPRLERIAALDECVDADVLDAWFAPSPRVVASLTAHGDRMQRTSPPPGAAPLVSMIARRWSSPDASIAVGAGSSDLIYRAFTEWLTPSSRVLLVDPTYPEYAHVVENVVGASLVRLSARRADGYRVPLDRLRASLHERWDLVVIVNPNNPTGTLLDRPTLASLLHECPRSTRVWIDEAYVHLAEDASVVELASRSENVFVARSFSKAYALSGLRAAFLAGPPADISVLQRKTPPWIVGFPGQVAVLRAFEDDAYYAARYGETRALRTQLARRLREQLGLDVFEGATASVLVHLDGRAESAREVCRKTAREGVFLRDASDFGPSIGSSTLRISVKSGALHDRVVHALARALG